jgi:hypothetical protein
MAVASQPPVCGLQVSTSTAAYAAATPITNVLLWQVVADALGMLNVLSSSPPLLLRTPSLSLLRQHCQVLSNFSEYVNFKQYGAFANSFSIFLRFSRV